MNAQEIIDTASAPVASDKGLLATAESPDIEPEVHPWPKT
jgi:hypothetical protein